MSSTLLIFTVNIFCRDDYEGRNSLVVVGDHNRYSDSSTPYEKTFTIDNVIEHSDHNYPSQYNNDIALVKLNAAIEFNEAVQPLCLPGENEDVHDYSRCVTTGWGRTHGKLS